MNINHIAIWTEDIECMKSFYETYFQAQAGKLYTNPQKQFKSYFLQFSSGARLELMQMPMESTSLPSHVPQRGYAHLAISVGSRDQVDRLTEQLKKAGYPIRSAPRITGDGYYESVVLDPEQNPIEITD